MNRKIGLALGYVMLALGITVVGCQSQSASSPASSTTVSPAGTRAAAAPGSAGTEPAGIAATQGGQGGRGGGGGGRGRGFSDTPTYPGPARSVAAALAGPNVYNIRNFGARGDGKQLDSPAIDKAITAAALSGGGTVLVPAGTYLSGSIHLKSNVNLCIDTGGTILGAPRNSPAYDPPEKYVGEQYQDGGHTYFHNSLIWGENLTNVSITGRGMIDGGGLTRGDSARVGAPGINTGDKAIALKSCTNVLIRDVTMFHGGHFAILVTGCNVMTIDNVTIDTNRDGMDIDCCQNTTVSNCRVNSPLDDAICPKATYALGKNVVTENLTITNCQVSGFEEGTLLNGKFLPSRQKNGRIKFGTESNGGFRNCVVSNCTFRACKGFALEEVDGGILDNIAVDNLTMMDVDQYAIYIRLGARQRALAGTPVGVIRNVHINNVVATGNANLNGIEIMGLPDHPVENVTLDNIRVIVTGGGTAQQALRVPPELPEMYPEPGRWGVMPSYGLYVRHAKNLDLSRVTLGFEKDDLRPAMTCVDVDGLEIERFKAQTAAGVKTAHLEAVKNLTIESSPALAADKIEQAAQETKSTETAPATQRGG